MSVPSKKVPMYISIYNSHHSLPVAVFDLKKRRFISNRLGLGLGGALSADLAYHECHGYKSPLVDLSKLPRNTRGCIDAKWVPKRMDTEKLQSVLPAAVVKGEKQTATGLKGGLTPENRFQKAKIITEQHLKRASELRAEGHPWRIVADALDVSISAIKTAHQRMTSV